MTVPAMTAKAALVLVLALSLSLLLATVTAQRYEATLADLDDATLTRTELATLETLVHSDDQILNQTLSDIYAARDYSVDPCDNFYQFSCGGWQANTPRRSDIAKVTRAFTMIRERNDRILSEILNSSLPTLSTFYNSCLSIENIDASDLAQLAPLLTMLNSSELTLSDYYQLIGILSRRLRIHPLVKLEVEIDQQQPSKQWLVLTQSGRNLNGRSQYEGARNISDEYQQHIETMLTLAGESPSQAKADARHIVEWEAKLAKIYLNRVYLRNPFHQFNPILSLGELYVIAPNIDWSSIFAGLSIDPKTIAMNMAAPQFFVDLNTLIGELGGEWQSTLLPHARWQLLHSLANDLPTPLRKEHFRFFGTMLNGLKAEQPRWQYCTGRATQLLNKLLDPLFIQRAFSPQSNRTVLAMIDEIKSVFRHTLANSSWMDAETRARAIEKLSLIVDNIGGTSEIDFRTYGSVNVTDDDYLSNVLELIEYSANGTFGRLFRPTDRHRWEMSASADNAYYSPESNSINFPAGIIQSPFFNSQYLPSLNAGGLAMIVGHEISHGFDDQGRLFDGEGRLVDWWTADSSAAFNERVDCFKQQYSNFTVPTSHGLERVNGNLTAGENVADNVGLLMAYRALQAMLGDSITEADKQLFFSAFASDWCQLITPEYAHQSLITDVHSPADARVNGALRNLADFAATFECPLNSPMNPSVKCTLYE